MTSVCWWWMKMVALMQWLVTILAAKCDLPYALRGSMRSMKAMLPRLAAYPNKYLPWRLGARRKFQPPLLEHVMDTRENTVS